MPNPGQPTISPGATGDVVRRLQWALRRTPNLGLTINGIFDSQTETAVKEFQQGAGIVGPLTWNALPLEDWRHRFLEAERVKAKGASRGFAEAGS
jgi:peptidoglycan hydrolase-like protein with peptidoglycan-binding domain